MTQAQAFLADFTLDCEEKLNGVGWTPGADGADGVGLRIQGLGFSGLRD